MCGGFAEKTHTDVARVRLDFVKAHFFFLQIGVFLNSNWCGAS